MPAQAIEVGALREHRGEYLRGDEYSTSPSVFRQLDLEFHFTLDPCANRHNAKCRKYFTKEQDGLTQSWANEVVFMNPPFGPQGRALIKWVGKAWYEAQMGATVVCLLPASTDTEWWHRYVMKASERRFIKGRLTYGGGVRCPFPSCVVVFRPLETSGVVARPLIPPRDVSFEVKP